MQATMVATASIEIPDGSLRQASESIFRRTSYASFPKDKGIKQAPASKTAIAKKAHKTKAKAVRFASPPKVTNRHEFMTSDDLPNAWYQPKDYCRIKMGILGSINAINGVLNNKSSHNSNSQPTLDLSEHCLRGIETAISAELYKRRKLRIKSNLHSVLEQQRIQRSRGVWDPIALAAISLRSSQDAQESALSVGQLDSKLC